MRRLDESPVDKLLVTDTIETQPVEPSRKADVFSIASLPVATPEEVSTYWGQEFRRACDASP